MPSELGRVDKGINYVPRGHLTGFLRIVREKITPRFDITPEILTHLCAYDLKTKGTLHVFEDVWVERASLREMTDYIALALRILKAVGLPANGVTSPWSTGITRERTYAEAIGRAQWRVHRRKRTWYFLHCLSPDTARRPWASWKDRRRGQTVVSVPANTSDWFWRTQGQPSQQAARAAALSAADTFLSADGRRGQVRQLLDKNMPITLLTHWQSLFSDGRAAGLRGLEVLLSRIEKNLSNEVEWVTCSRLARQAARHRLPAK
jgi:hypothetical protein